VYAQLGQQPLVRTTETSLELNPLSCLSARPPDLADAAGTRPRVVSLQYCTLYLNMRKIGYICISLGPDFRRVSALRHQLAWRREGGSVRA
jgi:hypothetical protein